jgi:glutamine phosphoribosylpyrophosphate amidotransferase
MCAVVGMVLRSPTTEDFQLATRVFHESRIRGLHATGISYVKGGKITTEKLAVPADEFPFEFENYVNEDGNLYLIGHCRYSTSDLQYNQPLGDSSISIVHNGVVTQELPENWKELYGYDTETKNDSELIYKTVGESPLEKWKDASISAIELYADKHIRFYRNGKRPIYLSLIQNGCIITSTKDIAIRAGVSMSDELPPNTYYTYDGKSLNQESLITLINTKDLQEVDYEELSV